MNRPIAFRRKRTYAWLLMAVSLAILCTRWSWRLYGMLDAQREDDLMDLSSLIRYLLGLVVLIVGIGFLAHLNYRLAFRRWILRDNKPLYYGIWLCWLTLGLFEGLQIRTDQEPTFVDENMVVTSLLMVFMIVYSLVADTLQTRRQQQQLIQQKTEAELTALKAQLNPHFLFNALNTIYNEAQRSENQSVADLISQLSGIMRFTIQESMRSSISIQQEFEFLEKYLALQRARLPQLDGLRVDTQLEWDGQPAELAPLLLIPFVENMFQYGISFSHPSCLSLDVTVENRQLQMRVVNTVGGATTQRSSPGTGIKNTRQRLAMLYPNQHELTIEQTDQYFRVTLQITL